MIPKAVPSCFGFEMTNGTQGNMTSAVARIWHIGPMRPMLTRLSANSKSGLERVGANGSQRADKQRVSGAIHHDDADRHDKLPRRVLERRAVDEAKQEVRAAHEAARNRDAQSVGQVVRWLRTHSDGAQPL
jgi:hypothetical protein